MDKKVFENIIRYASCWEDTENLLHAGEITQRQCISVISGGDNTLSLLTKDPARVVAFDLNRTQIALFRLKMAAIRELPYEQLLAFLGIMPCKDRLHLYKCLELDAETAAWFGQHPDVIQNGIIHAGKFEHYFQLFRSKVIPLFSSKQRFAEFALLEDTAEQLRFYYRYICNHRFRLISRTFFGAKTMGKLGRDRSFYRYVDDKESQSEEILKRFEFGIAHTINRTNPYLRYICTSNYAPEALPHYLQPDNVEIIRRRLDRIEIVCSDLYGLRGIQADFLNASDIFEYMSEFEFRRAIGAVRRLTSPGAALVYYNMQNRRYLTDNAFTFDRALSEELFRQNRSYFYRDFLIYRRT